MKVNRDAGLHELVCTKTAIMSGTTLPQVDTTIQVLLSPINVRAVKLSPDVEKFLNERAVYLERCKSIYIGNY